MSKDQVFNATNSEYVNQDVRARGEFNILHGSTGLLPSELQTAQGSNGIDTPAGATPTSLSEPVNPHGVLVRNPDQLPADAPAFASNGEILLGQVGVLNQQTAVRDSRAGSTVFGVDRNGEPEVTVTTVTRDTLSFPSNQSLVSDNVIPSVGSRFFR